MSIKKSIYSLAFAALITLTASADVWGQQLVFNFRNPAFGGNPLNYQWMLSSANAQNKYQNDGFGGFNRDPLADFQQSLQRQVLSQLTREIVSERFGNADLTQQGTFEFGEFTISVNPGSDGISITILNILTGDETTITVPNI
ncbi:curli production assembly/transport component CsgF [Balneola sp. MJW-20]|uniref:curli production assembly/transport component CsgF n=1 Tax=Gracilimonas aurantiaca TaxID=3234185 RepID=UPI00346520C5